MLSHVPLPSSGFQRERGEEREERAVTYLTVSAVIKLSERERERERERKRGEREREREGERERDGVERAAGGLYQNTTSNPGHSTLNPCWQFEEREGGERGEGD